MKQIERFTRSSLRGASIFKNIQELIYCLQLGYAPVYPVPSTGTSMARAAREQSGNPPASWQRMEREDIARFKILLDAQLKLLNKVLPDLKAIDLRDTTERPQLTPYELAQRLAGVLEIAKSENGPQERPRLELPVVGETMN